MKHRIITPLLLLIFLSGFSQNSKFEYTGRFTPTIKKAKLKEANFINEIMPEFSRYFILPFNEHDQFEKRKISIYPQANFYPQENYNYLFSYVSVEISVTCNDKVLTSRNTSDTLTAEQKNIINAAELGSDISIKIKLKFKNKGNDKPDSNSKITEGVYTVTVIPETEAEYPGGYKQFTEYLKENVFNKITEKRVSEKIQQAVVKFSVDEEGHVVDAKIVRTSTDSKIDELLLDAMNKMPKWAPAENSKGMKVKQEFSIPFGGGSGC